MSLGTLWGGALTVPPPKTQKAFLHIISQWRTDYELKAMTRSKREPFSNMLPAHWLLLREKR